MTDIKITPPADIETVRAQIEQNWIERAHATYLTHGSKKYRDREIEFFVGVMTALIAAGYDHGQAMPPMWIIPSIAGETIIKKDRFVAKELV